MPPSKKHCLCASHRFSCNCRMQSDLHTVEGKINSQKLLSFEFVFMTALEGLVYIQCICMHPLFYSVLQHTQNTGNETCT